MKALVILLTCAACCLAKTTTASTLNEIRNITKSYEVDDFQTESKLNSTTPRINDSFVNNRSNFTDDEGNNSTDGYIDTLNVTEIPTYIHQAENMNDSISVQNSTADEQCPLLTFPCRNSTGCVHFNKLCDAISDCPDGTDEDIELCKLGIEVTVCNDGQFIQGHDIRCDGYFDCNDGSDESGCSNQNLTDVSNGNNGSSSNSLIINSCPWQYQFQCGDGTCIDKFRVCDMVEDCPFGVDESVNQCAAFNTPFNRDTQLGFYKTHMCDNGQILLHRSAVKCDGKIDCDDASDEKECDNVYMCADGQQYIMSFQQVSCNGLMDCLDGSDEYNCGAQTESEFSTGHSYYSFNVSLIIIIMLIGTIFIFLFVIIAQHRVNKSLRRMLNKNVNKTKAIGVEKPSFRPPSYSVLYGSESNASA